MIARFYRIFALALTFALTPGNTIAGEKSVLLIDTCYLRAADHYPLSRQMQALAQMGALQVDMIAKGQLPQFLLAGQATHQSAVTQLPISLPNVQVPVLDKNQFRVYGEMSQSITAFRTVQTQQDLLRKNTEIEQQKTQVELYKVRDRVNGLYFGILLTDAQLQQNSLYEADIQSGIDRAQVALAAGTLLKSDLDQLKVALLRAEQKSAELNANRNAYMSMLAELTGLPLDQNVQLQMPEMPLSKPLINRPELRLFDLQRSYLREQERSVNDKLLPGLSLFVQGGVGQPGLNMLDNQVKTYYIGGVRLNWIFSNFYTAGKEKKLLRRNADITDIQRETFLMNTRMALQQYSAEIRKLEDLLLTDNEIIRLREEIVTQFKAQLNYGTTTVTDYINQVNAADQARQQYQMHAIQLAFAKFNYKNTTGI